MGIFTPNRKKIIVDLGKLERLIRHLECDADDIFEWVGYDPMEFMTQISQTVGFDVYDFIEKDIDEINFDNILTGEQLLKKIQEIYE